MKMVEYKLRWFGHVERSPIDSVVRRVDHMKDTQITGGKGRDAFYSNFTTQALRRENILVYEEKKVSRKCSYSEE